MTRGVRYVKPLFFLKAVKVMEIGICGARELLSTEALRRKPVNRPSINPLAESKAQHLYEFRRIRHRIRKC